MAEPTYKINVLSVADVKVSSAFMYYHAFADEWQWVPTHMFLITGNGIPVTLVDTGVKENTETLTKIFREMTGVTPPPENRSIKYQLAQFGYKPEDIQVLIHTHLHVDHAGNDLMFPNARVFINRQEMMFSVAGIDKGYPMEYIRDILTMFDIPGKVRLFDDEFELFPGIKLIPAGGHTLGSTIISVNTTKGKAYLCGDIIYTVKGQTQEMPYGNPAIAADFNSCADKFGEQISGNNVDQWGAKRYLQRIMREADIVLPSHDPDLIPTYGTTIE